jgi:hypothetical protein
MAPDYLASNGAIHLRGRFRFAFRPQTACHLVQISFGETAGSAQQNAIARFFNRELRAGRPSSGSPYCRGQNNLALSREPDSFHW